MKVPSSTVNNAISDSEFLEAFSASKINGKLAIACSGGIDSMCLAYVAAKHFDVVALIIDHGLRAESRGEAKQTLAILNKLGIEGHILSEQREIDSNIQAEARKLRFDLLTDYCKANGLATLATAHHADDNAETVLLKLSRGSGVDGLTGILPESEMNGVKLIRPLLSFTKNRLRASLVENEIEWVEDPTNITDKYKRNKLRHLLDEIEEPELVTSRLNDTAENMRRVRDYLELQTEAAEQECFDGECLDIANFTKLHDEIAYRLLVKIVMNKSGSIQRPRFEKIKSLKEALIKSEARTLAGLSFRSEDGKIVIKLEKDI